MTYRDFIDLSIRSRVETDYDKWDEICIYTNNNVEYKSVRHCSRHPNCITTRTSHYIDNIIITRKEFTKELEEVILQEYEDNKQLVKYIGKVEQFRKDRIAFYIKGNHIIYIPKCGEHKDSMTKFQLDKCLRGYILDDALYLYIRPFESLTDHDNHLPTNVDYDIINFFITKYPNIKTINLGVLKTNKFTIWKPVISINVNDRKIYDSIDNDDINGFVECNFNK